MGMNVYGYKYDPIGNRLTATNNAEAFAYAANELNQYTSIVDGGTVTPAYDDDGNLTSYGSWTYTWDGENRLVIATDGSAAVTNAYDFASRRVSNGTAVASRSFIYDGWNVIREFQVSGFSPQPSSFVWGLDLSQSLQSAGGVGGLLSVVRDGTPYFTGCDANGNVTEYISANGTTVAHYEFDPFGNTTAATGSMADAFAHRFSTKYWDSETALYYYGHRFYRPELGRWLGRDPLDELGGANLYAGVVNDLANQADGLGLCPQGMVEDDAKRCCCERDIQIVKVHAIIPFTEGHFVGHESITIPGCGTLGKYPKYGFPRNIIGPGEIRADDRVIAGRMQERPSKQRLTTRKYRACPESVTELQNRVEDDRNDTSWYMLFGGSCTDWPRSLLRRSGFNPERGGGMLTVPGSNMLPISPGSLIAIPL